MVHPVRGQVPWVAALAVLAFLTGTRGTRAGETQPNASPPPATPAAGTEGPMLPAYLPAAAPVNPQVNVAHLIHECLTNDGCITAEEQALCNAAADQTLQTQQKVDDKTVGAVDKI